MVAVTNPASFADRELGPSLVSPSGNEVADIGYATQAIKKGDPVMISGAAPNRQYPCSLANASGTDAVGICLKNVSAGGTCEYVKVGELDGYVGLTPGALLTVVAGKIDTTAPVNTVHYSYRVRAISASRLYVDFV